MNDVAKMSETEITARLKEQGANVVEKDGGLAVYLAVTDELISLAARLDRMTSLQASFWTGGPLLTGPELRHLKGHKNIRDLNITRMPISGEHLTVLPTLPKLQNLQCTPRESAKEALVHIGRCKGLRILSLHEAQIPDDCLESLRDLQNIENLELSGNPVSAGVSVVKHMKHLKQLSVDHTAVDDNGLRVISQLKELDHLYVGSSDVTDRGIEHLVQCKTLTNLAIGSAQVTSNGVRRLVNLPRLKYLDVRVPLSDATLIESLSGMKQLKDLVCAGSGISAAARQRLEVLLPKCEILWLDHEVSTQKGESSERQ